MNASTYYFLVFLLLTGFVLYGYGVFTGHGLINIIGFSLIIMSMASFTIDVDNVYRNQICKDAEDLDEQREEKHIKNMTTLMIIGIVVTSVFLLSHIGFTAFRNRAVVKGALSRVR